MRAGKLRQRVTIQTATESKDEFGEDDRVWHDVITVYADIQPARGREYERGGAIYQDATHRIRIRWRPGMTPDKRLKFSDRQNAVRLFDIEAIVDPSERGIMLDLYCQEIVGR